MVEKAIIFMGKGPGNDSTEKYQLFVGGYLIDETYNPDSGNREDVVEGIAQKFADVIIKIGSKGTPLVVGTINGRMIGRSPVRSVELSLLEESAENYFAGVLSRKIQSEPNPERRIIVGFDGSTLN